MKNNYLLISLSLLFFLACSTAFAQQRTVSGKVVDPNGTGFPGVNVIIKGTATGTTTNADGEYKIAVPDNNTVLVYSFIGYAAQEVTVGSRSVLDITLAEDVTQLSEVVVTALGVERSVKALQSSVTTVSGDNFTQARENNLGNV